MVLIQQTEPSCPKVAKFREIFTKVISDKHEDVIAKFGATLAQGILDAGKFLKDQNAGQSMVFSTIDPKPANTAVSLSTRREERRLNSQAIVSKNKNPFSVSVLLLAGVLPHCGCAHYIDAPHYKGICLRGVSFLLRRLACRGICQHRDPYYRDVLRLGFLKKRGVRLTGAGVFLELKIRMKEMLFASSCSFPSPLSAFFY